ncbi:hypothetical protein [Acidocella facilis]|uniref:hypothetical protein n=1 Tax=Acidocella facilis TaxID=525 RepID=UPI001F3A4905|nr:hypothetical protein [Acidocella facilis]
MPDFRVFTKIFHAWMSIFFILPCGAYGFPTSEKATPLAAQCSNLNINKNKLIPESIFPVHLEPYGSVCFVGHIIPDPLPGDAALGFDPAVTPYVALSLYQNGKDIYDFTWPNTPDYEWPPAIDGIISVAFRKLPGSKYTDVIVIGHSSGARGVDIYHPMIYVGTAKGFRFDQNLSDLMFQGDYATMPELLKAIGKIGISG